MDLEQQKEIITLYNQYQNIDRNTIKTNIKNYMDDMGLQPSKIAKITGMSIQTIYQLRKRNTYYKPDFITTTIFCSLLGISITEIMKPTPINIRKYKTRKTKWTITAKQNFVKDYSTLDTTLLCRKWNITPRTAQEYNKNFVRELQNLY